MQERENNMPTIADTFVFPQQWISEFFSGFLFTLGALFIWTFIARKEDSGITNKWTKRMYVGLALLGLTMISMFGGMFISNFHPDPAKSMEGDGGHGWGNPAFSMGLAMNQPVRVFTNWHVLVLGIFYVVFEFIGAAAALGVFVVYVWIHNQTHSEKEELIYLTKVFTFDTTHPVRGFAKDAIAVMMVTFAFVGATYMGVDHPSPMPAGELVGDDKRTLNVLFRFMSVMAVSFASMFAALAFGERMLITLNPIVWFAAFILKFSSHIMRNQKFRMVHFYSEFASPVATLGAGGVVGILMYGIMQIPAAVAI